MILVLSSMTGSNEHFGDPNQSATAGIVPSVIEGNIRRSHRSPLTKRRPVMSTFREKARGRTNQMVGQMIGDEKLVEEGREQEREAEQQAKSADAESAGAKSADDRSSDTKSADDRSGRASRH